MRVRVVKVNALRGEARNGVVYCGRSFAGWPASPRGNYDRLPCPGPYRESLMAMPPGRLDAMLADLWEATGHGDKPLGCYCVEWDGTGETPGCHAAVWAELLNQRYGKAVPT